jgi:membrane dipeptidase
MTDARSLHFDSIVVDGHSDTVARIIDHGEDLAQRSDKAHVDLPKMFEGGLDAEFFAAFVAPRFVERSQCAMRVLHSLDALKRLCDDNPDRIGIARSAADVRRLNSEGKKSCILSIEGGHAIEDELSVLRMFAELGVRYMTLTWNNTNNWADACAAEPTHGGLTDFGREVVREMQKIGVIVDVSHAHEKTFWAVIETAIRPIMASHACARAICDHRRNLNDEQLKAVAKNNGVVCVCFYPGFASEEYRKASTGIHEKEEAETRKMREEGKSDEEISAVEKKWGDEERRIPRPKVAAIVDQIEYVARVAGIDHVGLGSDFDGVPALPDGLEDASKLPALTEELVRRGHGEVDVRKILGENVLRVMKQTIDDV